MSEQYPQERTVADLLVDGGGTRKEIEYYEDPPRPTPVDESAGLDDAEAALSDARDALHRAIGERIDPDNLRLLADAYRFAARAGAIVEEVRAAEDTG